MGTHCTCKAYHLHLRFAGASPSIRSSSEVSMASASTRDLRDLSGGATWLGRGARYCAMADGESMDNKRAA